MKLTISLEDVQQAIANFVEKTPPVEPGTDIKPENITIIVKEDSTEHLYCDGAEIQLD